MKITEPLFNELAAQGYTHIPVIEELTADLETPLTIYLKLANQPYTYLFESVQGGERWGRYSFIGLPCNKIIRVYSGGKLTVTETEKIIFDEKLEDPLAWIENHLAHFKVPLLTEFMRFNGGLVGYFGYDTIRYIEPKLAHSSLHDPLNLPEILLMLSTEFIVFDSLLNKIYLVAYADVKMPNALAHAKTKIHTWIAQLKTTQISAHHYDIEKISTDKFYEANISKEEYQRSVEKAVDYMKSGDAMQIVLSQRLSKNFSATPLSFYRKLRLLNPSPYLFYLNLNDFYVIGSSPEILVRLEENKITLRPIAGTRPRGSTPEQDLTLEKELLSDPKELAEHTMLIDLGRNDVGRVSKIGSVKVTEKMVIERYSHVMHIVSNVQGELKENLSALAVLKATFPAGTLTGAPKIRAMEIIDELETVKRGIYGGAVGYLAWNGNMDLAIAIRTAVIKDNKMYVQAGAGLVIDSNPEDEWQECINKATALLRAATMTADKE